MIIKHPELTQHLRRQVLPLYVFVGNEPYLITTAIQQIKNKWSEQGECDHALLIIQQPQDWSIAIQDAQHDSLFTPYHCLKLSYDKKTIDKASLAALTAYLEKPNPKCLILIEAINVLAKQLQAIANHPNAALLNAYSLSDSAFQQHLQQHLRAKKISFEPDIIGLIHQYTHRNMLAALQLLETLDLYLEPGQKVTAAILKGFLSDQSDYSLFELSESVLSFQSTKALRQLRHFQQNQTEPSLVLWLLNQEIQLLLQWHDGLAHGISRDTICKKLNIWPQKAQQYISAIQYLTRFQLQETIRVLSKIDQQIKTSSSQQQIWHALENVVLGLTLLKRSKPHESLVNEIRT